MCVGGRESQSAVLGNRNRIWGGGRGGNRRGGDDTMSVFELLEKKEAHVRLQVRG